MCYNEPVSWITLTIGTLFSALNLYKYHNNYQIVVITLAWFIAVFMQFWEAMLYRSASDKKSCIFYTKGAYINNLIQPLPLMLLAFQNKNKWNVNASIFVLAFYLIFSYFNTRLPKNYCALIDGKIDYKWWKATVWSNSIVYLITTALLMYFLLDKKIRYFELTLYIVSYILSRFINKNFIASIWCWLAAFIPLANYLYFTYYLKI
jgi:hypothetical protein